MSDFVQTMKDWRRMCKAIGGICCEGCKLNVYGNDCVAVYEGEMDYAKVEKAVTDWAAEHPEPVYPTWYEFMRENKIIPDVLEDCGDYYKTIGKWLVKATIKHEIAQKLGIEPKEGT